MNQYAAVTGTASAVEADRAPEGEDATDTVADAPSSGEYPRMDFPESRPLVIDYIEVVPTQGESLRTGKRAKVIFRYRSRIQARVIWAFTLQTADLQVAIASCTRGMDGEGSRITPGEHSLACLLPELLLRPGVYAIRGGIGDAISQAALAVRGYEDSPCFFTVAAQEASRGNNWQQLQNDLVDLKVEWL
jgi:hypothetical protein